MFVYLHSRSTGAAPDSVPGRSDDTGDTEEAGLILGWGCVVPGRTDFHVGLMAEWLGKGLQNLVQRFESASDLTETALQMPATRFSFCLMASFLMCIALWRVLDRVRHSVCHVTGLFCVGPRVVIAPLSCGTLMLSFVFRECRALSVVS